MQLDPARYLRTFFDEATEHVATLEGALLRLESGPHEPDLVDAAFRAAHSVKGGADAVGLSHIAKFTHAVEGHLERSRGGGKVPRRVLDLLLEATDMLGRLVSAARSGESVPPGADELLTRLAGKGSDPAAPKSWWEAPKGLDQFKSQPGTALVPTTYTVTVTPHADALRSGLDPLPLLRELAALGTAERVELNAGALPPLSDLDPERCYVAWTVRLSTLRTPDAVRDLFAFAPDLISVAISPDRAAPAAEPAVARSGSWGSSLERRLPVPDPIRFVNFLVQRGTITAEQGLAALTRHQEGRPTLGLVATRARLVTVEKLKGMLGRMEPGEGFGAAAVRLGHLSDADLGRLLLLQEGQTPPLGDCLLELGAVTRDGLGAALAAYCAKAGAEADPAASYRDLPAAVEMPRSPGASLLNENGAMIGDFCAEASEHLETADRNLLVIDADPTNADALNAVYRGFHTIKGVSSMLGLAAVQMLAHEAENLLNLAREGKVRLQGKPMDLVFASTDALKRQVAFIRAWSLEGGTLAQDPALPALLAELRAAVGGPPGPKSPKPAKAPPTPAPKVEPVPPAAPEPLPATPAPAPKAEKADAAPPEGAAPRRAADKETVRVDKDRLDKLVNTIGELVIAQSMAQQEYDELTNGSGVASLALPELAKISRDLQELSLGLRMVPLQGTFQKMARLVRDLSRKMDKPVELALHGEETELDKTVVDQLGDPLMHMVRNAIDHGLEEPDERVAAGKPRTGHVALRAFHQGGSVFIELIDDGKGLDRDRILKKALEKGIIAEGQRLSDSEIYALIFEPGFSTAKAVTDVSGRGVGMDVVRRNVEALQGTIIIRTQPGKGTTFTIRLPLTLAIMDGLMVGLCDDVYVLPLLSVVESFRPRPVDLHRVAGRGEAVTVRGEVVPLLRLHRLFGRSSRVTDPCKGLVVLVEDQGKKHAILVDELLGQMQAVVKSLDANYRRVEGLAGATILGDGRVAMILDIHGLAQLHAQCGGGAPEPALAASDSDTLFGDLS